jgi:hypothetical protein
MSAIELTIGTHVVRVIVTNNFQGCVTVIRSGCYTLQHHDEARLAFGQYQHLLSRRHFDPWGMKGTLYLRMLILAPLYQNLHNL